MTADAFSLPVQHLSIQRNRAQQFGMLAPTSLWHHYRYCRVTIVLATVLLVFFPQQNVQLYCRRDHQIRRINSSRNRCWNTNIVESGLFVTQGRQKKWRICRMTNKPDFGLFVTFVRFIRQLRLIRRDFTHVMNFGRFTSTTLCIISVQKRKTKCDRLSYSYLFSVEKKVVMSSKKSASNMINKPVWKQWN